VYLAALGATGLRRCATLNVERTHAMAERVTAVGGFSRRFAAPTFNELAIRVPAGTSGAAVLAALRERRILGGVDLGRWYPDLADCILMTATELTTDAEIDALGAALGAIAKEPQVVRN